MSLSVENVVATAVLDSRLNLEAVEDALPAQWSRVRRFRSLVCRLPRPRVTLLIFEVGKVVCTGAKSEAEAFSVINSFFEAVKARGLRVGEAKVSVQNVVVSSQLGFEVDLEKASKNLGGVYEPERFPGLIMKREGASILVFSNGRVVCAGAKSAEKAYRLIGEVGSKLSSLPHEPA